MRAQQITQPEIYPTPESESHARAFAPGSGISGGQESADPAPCQLDKCVKFTDKSFHVRLSRGQFAGALLSSKPYSEAEALVSSVAAAT